MATLIVPSVSMLTAPESIVLPTSLALEPIYRLLDRDTQNAPATAFVRALRVTLCLRETVAASGSPWREPFVSVKESGEVVLEWWNGARKLTFYFGETGSDYLKLWGDDIAAEMQDGAIDEATIGKLWRWLI